MVVLIILFKQLRCKLAYGVKQLASCKCKWRTLIGKTAEEPVVNKTPTFQSDNVRKYHRRQKLNTLAKICNAKYCNHLFEGREHTRDSTTRKNSVSYTYIHTRAWIYIRMWNKVRISKIEST